MSRSSQAFYDLCESRGWEAQDNGPFEGPQELEQQREKEQQKETLQWYDDNRKKEH